ncbi:MAG: hypothetical protein IH840_14650 [Candidatus Heimdallarchaeota archaeon]|nr:hypothetical protein [Candidatus Heimdallarchaeota archaeon]
MDWKTSGIPFYRARELAVLSEKGSVDNELFITKEMYHSFKRLHGVPKIGDMLVTGVGTLGKVYVVPNDKEFYFKDGNIIWFKIRGSVNSEFLKQLYSTKMITKQIEGGAGKTTSTINIGAALTSLKKNVSIIDLMETYFFGSVMVNHVSVFVCFMNMILF